MLAVRIARHSQEGWDNAAFQVNQRLVFRFPRRTVATRRSRRWVHMPCAMRLCDCADLKLSADERDERGY